METSEEAPTKLFRVKAPIEEVVKVEGKPSLAAKGDRSLTGAPWVGQSLPHPAGLLPGDVWKELSHMMGPGWWQRVSRPTPFRARQAGVCLSLGRLLEG